MFEPTQIENWIYTVSSGIPTVSALLTDAEGKRIWSYSAERQVYPFEIYNLQGATDVKPLGVNRIMVSTIYQIKLVIKGRPNNAIRTALDDLDNAFDRARSQQLNGWAFSSWRREPIKYEEREEGNTNVKYFHLGGLYHIQAFQL